MVSAQCLYNVSISITVMFHKILILQVLTVQTRTLIGISSILSSAAASYDIQINYKTRTCFIQCVKMQITLYPISCLGGRR